MDSNRHFTEQQREFHRVADLRFKVFCAWAVFVLLFVMFYPL